MKSRIIKILLIILAVLVGGYFLNKFILATPGYVLISLGKTTVEVNFWFAVVMLIAFLIAYKYLKKAALFMVRVFKRVLGIKSQQKLMRQTSQGVIEYLVGNYEISRKLLLRSANRSPMPEINLMVAAYAMQKLGNSEKALEILDESQQYNTGVLAIRLAKSEILEEQGRHSEAIELLESDDELTGNVLIQERLCSLYAEAGQWQNVKQILPKIKKQLTESKWHQLQVHLTEFELDNLVEQYRNETPAKIAEKLQIKWLELPTSLQTHQPLLIHYVKLLQRQKALKLSEDAVKKSIEARWNAELVVVYGLLESEKPDKQLKTAESWLGDHSDDAGLYLSLGRICLRNHLWGQAEDYFKQSIRLGALKEAAAELARLYENMGKSKESLEVLKQSYLSCEPPLPQLPMPGVKH